MTADWPSPRKAWGFVALLFLAGLFSVIDRAVLNVVVDPVRHDLGIGDQQIGLLQGLAFGLFYAFMGLPMGLLADRKSRRNLVILGIGLWSMATIASGLAQSFGQIFTARLLVGLGEAALSPAAISLIADLFPPARRGRPLSVFMLGQSLANGTGHRGHRSYPFARCIGGLCGSAAGRRSGAVAAGLRAVRRGWTCRCGATPPVP
ncbi:MFS transporter [Novosphingobium sp. MW5]|nr:MFS transporter [Novosphingobium sp. MW5]